MGLSERDSRVIWHPYTRHSSDDPPLLVRSAQGAYLELEDGTRVLDAISSWWVNIHGHGHPKIVEAIANQARRLDHVLFAGFTHEPAIELAEALIASARQASTDLSRVFYSDNGSTAVETSLKLAFLFHRNQKDNRRQRFIALHGAFHGDTLGAMSLGEPQGFHRKFRELLAPVDFVRPGDLTSLARLLAERPGEHAAFVFEPLLQGAEGMRIYSPDYLREAIALCRSAGILTIADEVFTGFYRTGSLFAFSQAGVSPDLACLAKGLSGGTLPLAATLISERIFEAFSSPEHAFLHGHSYTGNPIACAAALASWKLLHTPECQDRIQRIGKLTSDSLDWLREHPTVAAARGIGTIGAIELRENFGYGSLRATALRRRALQLGVLLRPLGNVLYATPPYCVTDQEVARIYQVMEELIDDEHG